MLESSSNKLDGRAVIKSKKTVFLSRINIWVIEGWKIFQKYHYVLIIFSPAVHDQLQTIDPRLHRLALDLGELFLSDDAETDYYDHHSTQSVTDFEILFRMAVEAIQTGIGEKENTQRDHKEILKQITREPIIVCTLQLGLIHSTDSDLWTISTTNSLH